jgi:hypothetical protein
MGEVAIWWRCAHFFKNAGCVGNRSGKILEKTGIYF